MKARLAKMSDISDILALAKAELPATNYRGLPFNAVVARRTVQRSMTSADARVWVAVDEGGRIHGFLIGEIGEMTHVAHMAATDLAFMADAGGDLLLEAFVQWCKLRKVARIDMGVSAGPEREPAMRRMFERAGFSYSGPMFHMNLLGGDDGERGQEGL